ncbi:MAG: hypothetical protein OEU54_06675 [Gemmatimonadota bacterium]|nr:hypothetical protein [Gemmatimonadota bacterium]
MGEGLEVLLWLGIMGFIALRSAMQRQRKRGSRSEGSTPSEGSLADLLSGDPTDDRPQPDQRRGTGTEVTRRGPAAPSRSEDAGARATSGEKRGGLLSRWSELAAEFERQVQEQQASAREAARPASSEEPERLVVVPGRRVYPTEAGSDEARSRESHWSDWQSDPQSHGLHSDVSAGGARESHVPHQRGSATPAKGLSGRRERRSGAGLARLESLHPLKRAIILSELLGPPPGLEGVAPAERRLGPIGRPGAASPLREASQADDPD